MHTTNPGIKNMLKRIALSPAKKVFSSQTVYESLLACMDLYELTDGEFWLENCKHLCKLLIGIQQPDGGFDIGYNFRFGENLAKKRQLESTTPEVIGLYALCKYHDLFDTPSVKPNIERGLAWILRHSYSIDTDRSAIPYAPNTVSDVHIVNCVSFTLPVLAWYYARNGSNNEIEKIYRGMILFLSGELESGPNQNGKYWRYFYREGRAFPKGKLKFKVDNYHIGQQLRYHCVAQKLYPLPENAKVIAEVAQYLRDIQRSDGLIFYYYPREVFGSEIHIWGYASCAKGLIEAYHLLNDQSFLEASRKIIQWVIRSSWNGSYFYPILSEDGRVIDRNFYPRSDAWVVHSIAHFMKLAGIDDNLLNICKQSLSNLRKTNFTGKENHAYTMRNAFSMKLIGSFRSFLRRDYYRY